VISSAIIENIFGQLQDSKANIAYFYFDFSDVQKQTVEGCLRSLLRYLSARELPAIVEALYTIDQGSPCPLATLNPFGRELLLSDVSTGFKRSTWIERSIMYMIMYMIMNMTSYDHEHEHVHEHDHEGHIEAKPLIFKVRPVL
jgi:hypothetical protein